MSVTRKYTGEEGRYYGGLPLADGTVGLEPEPGRSYELAGADDVPTDGRWEMPPKPKKTAGRRRAEQATEPVDETPEPEPEPEPEPGVTEAGSVSAPQESEF